MLFEFYFGRTSKFFVWNVHHFLRRTLYIHRIQSCRILIEDFFNGKRQNFLQSEGFRVQSTRVISTTVEDKKIGAYNG
jgi:hypothetical protein